MRNFLLSDSGLSGAATMMQGLFRAVLGPVLTVIGIAAVIYAIVLGINYAKAEDAEARKKVQGRLIGALIGAVIIIAGSVLCFALDWVTIFNGFVTDSGIGDVQITSVIKAFLN